MINFLCLEREWVHFSATSWIVIIIGFPCHPVLLHASTGAEKQLQITCEDTDRLRSNETVYTAQEVGWVSWLWFADTV